MMETWCNKGALQVGLFRSRRVREKRVHIREDIDDSACHRSAITECARHP